MADLFDQFDMTPRLRDVTDPRTLARRDDPETSKEAAESIDAKRLEAVVLAVIRSFGPQGCISDEVRTCLPDLSYSSVTARYAALREKGRIVCGPDTRKGVSGRGQRVMRVTHAVG